jgi:magnesium-transporting ATPase (P-type)
MTSDRISMLTTSFAITTSVVALVLTAAMKDATPVLAYLHFTVAALTAAVCVALAVSDANRLVAAKASPSALAASNAGHLGMVWIWGAIALLVTYGTHVLTWKEWMTFFLVFFLAAGLCLFFSATLKKDASEGKVDNSMLNIARTLTMVQMVSMGVVVIGLLVDGKMSRFMTPRFTDWAANNIFFAGAIAVAAICAYALKTVPKPTA